MVNSLQHRRLKSFCTKAFVVVLVCSTNIAVGAEWRSATGKVAPAAADFPLESGTPATPSSPTDSRSSFVRELSPTGLPNSAGQVWREYDLRPYTQKQVGVEKPEQAVVDWVLRETGTDLWFSEPLGILNATRTSLRVYHTPEVQATVEGVVRRFVEGNASDQVFGVRLMTLLSPSWRNLTNNQLRPLTVQTPGVQAWVTSRENAAVLLDALRKRTDYREHNTPNLLVHSGQRHVISRTRPLAYVRDLVPRDPNSLLGIESTAGPQIEMGQIEEGFTLELNPLLSADRRYVDAAVKLETSHVEKLTPVWVATPLPTRTKQSTQIQVPQTASWRMLERFRWGSDDVLLVSCGLIANPGAERKAAAGLGGGLLAGPTRTEALVMIESKGRATEPTATDTETIRTGGLNYRGRY